MDTKGAVCRLPTQGSMVNKPYIGLVESRPPYASDDIDIVVM